MRQVARRALEEWNLTTYEEQVLLLATELMSNGVRHAMTALKFEMSYDGHCLRVAVSDSSRRLPVRKWSDDDSAHGWGLHLVDVLASDWGTTEEEDGKTVWFELRTPALPT